MSARQQHRDHIAALAKQSFADHTIIREVKTEELSYWCVGKPSTSFYRFHVTTSPGCIVQYGDVGGLYIAQGVRYGLPWLTDAINSMDYVLEKTNHKKDHFYEEMFAEVLAEHRTEDGEDPFETEYEGGYPDYMRFMMEHPDREAHYSCHDWSSDALWGYWALHTFVRLWKSNVPTDARIAP